MDMKPENSTAAIKALVAAQLNMGKALKSASNPHFKSKYADLSSVRDACFPALNANGFAIMQPSGVDEVGEYVETIFLHETGVSFTTRVYLKIGKGDMQGYGSAITYARRYGLLSLSGLAPEDDDGNAAAAQPPEQNRQLRRPAPPNATEHGKAIAWLESAASYDELNHRWGKISEDRPHIAGMQIVKDAFTEAAKRFTPNDEAAA